MNASPSPHWIWLANSNLPSSNVYARFSSNFYTSAPSKCFARISVAGNYVMRINGSVAAFGQYTDYPHDKTFTETSLLPFLLNGSNTIEIDVYFSGNRFSSHYDGSPGLWAEIIADDSRVCTSSSQWLSSPLSNYAFGERSILFVSLNYTYDFDARASLPPFAPSVELNTQISPRPRPTPPVADLGFSPAKCISSGSDFALFDLGEECTGLLQFSLSALGSERIEILHGEYLKDGRLQDFSISNNPNNQRSVIDFYTCRPGEQTFTHYLRRYGCRFIELRSSSFSSVQISSIGLRITEHPHLTTPNFLCSDSLFVQMHEISCRTLRCCLHEKYENCPWREQSICEYDARNQMLFGYPLWGNYDHAAAMIRLFAQSETPHGFLTAITPSASKTLIPMFTFPWLISICEYSFFSGDFSLFNNLAPSIERILSRILSHKSNGLFTIPPLNDYWIWNYCEPNNLEFCNDPPNAFYNLYLREALLKLAPLFKNHDRPDLASLYSTIAGELSSICVNTFWDEESGTFANSVNSSGNRENFFGHIQALFLSQGLISSNKLPRVINAIRSNIVPLPELPALPYLIQGLFDFGSDDDRLWMHNTLRKIYGDQISAGSTTWWEAHNGKEYGGGSGSLCHGWSAVPAWYTARYILGFIPTSPGCETYEIHPSIPRGTITSASGTIHTPKGPIQISWEESNGQILSTVHNL